VFCHVGIKHKNEVILYVEDQLYCDIEKEKQKKVVQTNIINSEVIHFFIFNDADQMQWIVFCFTFYNI
jgi:hypothetical protein